MKKLLLAAICSISAMGAVTAQEIRLEHEVIDYGRIAVGANGEREAVFTNVGPYPLIISSAKASCTCVKVKFPREPIAPGKQGKIIVTYDTKRMGPIIKTITLTSNSIGGPVVFRLKGSVDPPDGPGSTPPPSK